ncbi:protein-tyrosine phosphatase-like protein [Zopfochytrium polystomum]|nr:protein-tyrosine phosphatase-like protein [Zopfochytrium polystomum]
MSVDATPAPEIRDTVSSSNSVGPAGPAANGSISTVTAPTPSSPNPVRRPSPTHSETSNSKMPTRTIPFSRVMTSIEYRNMRFVVFDCPTDTTLPFYVEELKSRGVTDIVRVCEPTYNKDYCVANGIRVADSPFPDGSIPPTAVIQNFLALCDEKFPGGIGGASNYTGDTDPSIPAIAVHCVAGLGRAPVLVAICFIEAGMAPLDAVEFIRRRRRGAFNTVQLSYLVDTYKRMWTKKTTKMSFLSKRSVSPNVAAGPAAVLAPNTGGAQLVMPSAPAVVNGSCAGGDDESNASGASASATAPPKPSLKESLSKVFGGFKKRESVAG